jgi:thioredoxin reductase (NADPH)
LSDLHKVIIIGSGPAGYTAAIYCARARLNPLLFQGPQPGGQLTTTTLVENYPGFPDGVMGPELMESMRLQAENVGTRLISDLVSRVDFSSSPFKVWAGDTHHESEAVIIATGATAKTLGLPEEAALMGHGLSTCAVCDGFFFRGKKVVVVGGGDTAMEDALYLSRIADEVTVIHRRDTLRASKIAQDRAFSSPKIKFKWNRVVSAIHDPQMGKVTSVVLKSALNGEAETLDADGIFFAIGHTPNTAIFRGQLDMDSQGYIKVFNGTTATSVLGVFAAGDAVDFRYRQAVTAAGTGCMAAIDAERFLEHSGKR